MTTPAPTSPGPALEPGWTRAPANRHGRCYQRYVPDRGILRVTAGPGGTYAWCLGYSPAVPFTTPVEGFTSPEAAMGDASTQTALMPPGTFDELSPAEAVALYLRLSRAQGVDLGGALPELFRRIRVLSLAPGYGGPHPAAVSSLAGLWMRTAESTRLRETDFDAGQLHAPEPARDHLSRAAAHLLSARPAAADQELNLAMEAARGHGSWEAIRDLRGRMNDATAADSAGRLIRRFDRVTFPVFGRREAGVVEWVSGANGRNGGREALVYPTGLHLAAGCWVSVPYGDLTVTAHGTDPAGPGAALPYASYLPPGTSLETAGRAALAIAIRRGKFTGEGSTRQAIAYHQEHHNAGAGKGTIGRCPSPRCQTAAADWRNWSRQAAAEWRNRAGQFTGAADVTAASARRPGTSPPRPRRTTAAADAAARGAR